MPAGVVSLSLFPLNRNVHDIALPIDEQEGEIGKFQWLGVALENNKHIHILLIEFQHNVIWLESSVRSGS